MRLLFAMLLTLTGLIGCAPLPAETPIDRLRQPAAECASALAGDSMPAARGNCLPLLSQLEAAGAW